MTLTTLLVVVVAASFVLGHFVTRYLSRYIWLTGSEYLLVGVVLGPTFAPRLITAEVLHHLAPFVSLLLGMVGFSVGIGARRRMGGSQDAGAGIFAAALVTVGVGAAFMLLLDVLTAGDFQGPVLYQGTLATVGAFTATVYLSSDQLLVGAVIGAAACVSTVSAVLDGDTTLRGAKGPVTSVLRAAGASSQVVAVLTLGIALATWQATDEASRFGIGITTWAIAAAATGVVCGVLFSLFIGRESDPSKVFLATVGVVIFASGVGSALGISPLFTNLVAGMVVAWTSPHGETVRLEVERLRHPLLMLVMMFAGASWVPVTGWFWICPLVYVVLRVLLRLAFTRVAVNTVLATPPTTTRLGNGLLGQGVLAVAIALSFAQEDPTFGPLVLTTAAIGTLASDLWARRALRALIVDAGEVDDLLSKPEGTAA